MITSSKIAGTRSGANLGTAMAAVLALSFGTMNAAPASAQNPAAVTPAETLTLGVGRGSMVRLNSPMSDLFVADDKVADVQVRSSNQLYVFGKAKGETTVYATDKTGRVVFSANVRVGNNLSSVDDMLRLAMPDASIEVTPMNGIVLLTGVVGSPNDVEEASRLVTAYVGDGVQVLSRLRTATPLQVNLSVKIAEVNRSRLKEIGVNLLSQTNLGDNFSFGIQRTSRPTKPLIDLKTGQPTGEIGFDLVADGIATALFGGKLLGVDLLGAIDLSEKDGMVTLLAEPNLTALSGETASFLAGGEFPIPISQAFGTIAIEYKQYGVSLAFTPYVLADGRISMRVRPEVSELSNEGSIRLNGFIVPALTTRRAETTVELGSGQSFMIGGLLRNANQNTIDKAPFLGDIPILGALFRSNSYRRQETELVIIVTPYLVKPTSAKLASPTDGYKNPGDAARILGGQTFQGVNGQRPPQPRMGPAQTVRPEAVLGQGVSSRTPAQARGSANANTKAKTKTTASASPGFNF